jgi:hypothetical protein
MDPAHCVASPTLPTVYETPATAEAWRYLQALGCTRTFHELHLDGTITHYAVIARDGHIIATGNDTSEGLANVIAVLAALQAVMRGPLTI